MSKFIISHPKPQTHQTNQKSKTPYVSRSKLTKDALASKLPPLATLYRAIWKMSPDCTDTGINEGADAFSLQSTIAPERRVVVYVINKLPRVVLSRKLREDDSTRHDARFAGFEMTERMVALNVIAMWLRGMPRTQLKKYMIKNEKYLPELDLFILPRGFVGYMRK